MCRVRAGLADFRSVPVEHCCDAHGLVLRGAAGWSLAVSGDTRPCAALAAAGRGATLLVHEATFEPALAAQVSERPDYLREDTKSLVLPA